MLHQTLQSYDTFKPKDLSAQSIAQQEEQLKTNSRTGGSFTRVEYCLHIVVEFQITPQDDQTVPDFRNMTCPNQNQMNEFSFEQLLLVCFFYYFSANKRSNINSWFAKDDGVTKTTATFPWTTVRRITVE